MAINNAINQYPIVDALLGSWTPGAGTITSADSILTAMQKISGSSASLSGNNVWTGTNSFDNTVTFSALTASTVPYLDASKNLTSSAVTPTELGYVSGVTSAIQTQLGTKVNLDQTVGQTIGATGARLTMLWATDITVTNAIVGSITGNAATATALATARTIGGVSFDGTANITVASAIAGFAVSGGTFSSSGNALFVTNALTVTASNKRIGVGTASPEYAYHHHTSGGGIYAVWGDVPFTGGIRFSNPTADASNGYNVISAIGNRDIATAQGLIIIGGIKSATEDTGTVAITEYRSYVGLSAPVASTTRPTYAWKNFNTIQMQLGAAGALTLGATAGTGTGALYAGAGTFTGKVQVGSTAPTQSQGSALTVNSDITTGAAGTGSIIVQGEANKERIKIYSAGGSGTGSPLINMFSFRGSIASPTATQLGDIISGLSGGGYKATGYSGNQYAFIQYVTENWTDTATGCYIAFFTVPNGSTSFTGRLLINHDGAVTLGSSFGTGTGALYAGATQVTSLQCDSITNDTGLAAGTYTPTLTNTTNISASTAYECQYMRVGNTVTVSGKVDVDPTSASVATALGISLPIASNFGTAQDCGGTGASVQFVGKSTGIYADTTNDRATMEWINDANVANQSLFFTFTYQVI